MLCHLKKTWLGTYNRINSAYCSVFSGEKTHFQQSGWQPGPPAVTLWWKLWDRSASGMRPRTPSHPQSGLRPVGSVQGSGSSLWNDGNTGPPASPKKTEASQREGRPGPDLESNHQSVASTKQTSGFKSCFWTFQANTEDA